MATLVLFLCTLHVSSQQAWALQQKKAHITLIPFLSLSLSLSLSLHTAQLLARFTSSSLAFTAMREQVIVLPPSVERRKTSFSLSKKEEGLLNTSKESMNWAVSEGGNAEQIRGFALIERDHREPILASAEAVKQDDANKASAEPSRGAHVEEKQDKAYEEGSLATERMRNPPSSNGEGSLFLQWGLRKLSRFSRADTHNPSSRVDNHNLKPGSLADESSVLYRKTMRVQADRASAAQANTSSYASKGNLKAKNVVVAKREHLWSEEKQNPQAKVLKGGSSDVKQGTKGSPSRGGKRGYPSAQLLQQSKTCTVTDPNSPPKDRCVTPLPGSNNATLSKNELVWPKFVMGLSRKERGRFSYLKGHQASAAAQTQAQSS